MTRICLYITASRGRGEKTHNITNIEKIRCLIRLQAYRRIITILQKYVGIRQATKEGFIECEIPGVADLSYPTSRLRRGRVQGGAEIAYNHNNYGSVQDHE